LTLVSISTLTQSTQISRKLKATLALAQYKTTRGWENLSLAAIEPKVEEELRLRRPLSSGDILSDSSSSSASNSEFHFPASRQLMSSPLKEAAIFSDQIGPRSGTRSGSGYPKRTYRDAFDLPGSSSSKKYRSSPTTFRNTVGRSAIPFNNLQQASRSTPLELLLCPTATILPTLLLYQMMKKTHSPSIPSTTSAHLPHALLPQFAIEATEAVETRTRMAS
jgi:hypothetical protein